MTKVLLVEVLRDGDKYKKAYPGLLEDCKVVSLYNWNKQLPGLKITRAFVAGNVIHDSGLPGMAAARAFDCLEREMTRTRWASDLNSDLVVDANIIALPWLPERARD